MSDRPESANGLIKALRQVYEAAIEIALVDNNPAASLKLLKSNNAEGFHAWSISEVEKYEATQPIGTKARLALALFLYTGQQRTSARCQGDCNSGLFGLSGCVTHASRYPASLRHALLTESPNKPSQ